MSQANVDVVRTFQDKFAEGDIDAVLSTLADDVVIHECANLPYPGDHRGKDGFLKLVDAFRQTWEVQVHGDHELLPAGDEKVLCLVNNKVVAKATGTPLDLRIAEIFTIREGEISEVDVYYWDNVEAVQATNGVVVLQGERA